MFGISFFELLVICILVLIFFGPEKLPEIARYIGKLSADLKKTSDSVKKEFYNSVYKPLSEEELRSSRRELRPALPMTEKPPVDSTTEEKPANRIEVPNPDVSGTSKHNETTETDPLNHSTPHDPKSDEDLSKKRLEEG